ncbi:hypothetical protein I4U23_000146 [Adineta vaga]|nr:hypothetical protein I4U23_000146 [Adineta vaga]
MTEQEENFRDCLRWNENKEEFRLIWLDENINNSDDSLKTQQMLLELNPSAQFYTNTNEFFEIIKSIKNEQIILIISGSFAQIILSILDLYKTIIFIFIFCSNHEYHLSLMNKSTKIHGIFTNQITLYESLYQTINHFNKQIIKFNLFDQKQNLSKDLSKESSLFLWHQMIFNILQQMPQNDQSKDDLLQQCKEYYK